MTEQEIESYIHKDTTGHTVAEKHRHYKMCSVYSMDYPYVELRAPYPVEHKKNTIYSVLLNYIDKAIIEIDESEFITDGAFDEEKIIAAMFKYEIDEKFWKAKTEEQADPEVTSDPSS